jgi:tripartite ATP-independent transporter DctM subunit
MMLAFIGIVFFATVAIGVPVAFGMGLAGATWILFFEGLEPTILARRLYFALGSFPLLAIPLFIMLGFLAERTGMLPQLVTWLRMLFGRTRGGMAYVNVVASMLFAGVSGTAVSDIASLGRILIQLMTRAGYPVAYAAALTSATSIMAPIIPPSVAMIIYALAVGNISVGAMFMAGVVPGLLFGGGFLTMAWYSTRRHKYGILLDRPSGREVFAQTLRVVPFLVLPVIIVGGIRFGVFTVTESAAIGVSYTLLFGFLRTPRLTLKDVYEATVYSAVASSVAGALLGAGAIVAWIMTYNGVTQILADFLLSVTSNPVVFMLLVAGLLLILGMLMDAVPIMIALAPLLAPIAKIYGIADIQFALVFVITCLIGLVTPPVGIILFMVSSIANVTLERLSLSVLPFVIWMTIVLMLMIFFPGVTLWFPRLLGM